MSIKEKWNKAKCGLKRGTQIARNGLNSKSGRAVIAAGAAGVARLALPAHPVGAVAVLAVAAGVQTWADLSE